MVCKQHLTRFLVKGKEEYALVDADSLIEWMLAHGVRRNAMDEACLDHTFQEILVCEHLACAVVEKTVGIGHIIRCKHEVLVSGMGLYDLQHIFQRIIHEIVIAVENDNPIAGGDLYRSVARRIGADIVRHLHELDYTVAFGIALAYLGGKVCASVIHYDMLYFTPPDGFANRLCLRILSMQREMQSSRLYTGVTTLNIISSYFLNVINFRL